METQSLNEEVLPKFENKLKEYVVEYTVDGARKDYGAVQLKIKKITI